MKKISRLICATLALAMLFSLPQLSAQSNSDDMTISHKITDQEGNVVVKKKRLKDGESIQSYLDNFEGNFSNITNVEVTVAENGNSISIAQSSDSDNWEQELIKEMKDMERELTKFHEKEHKKKYKNYNYNYNYNYDYSQNHNGKKRALLGIYPSYTNEGVMISSLVSGGGAQAAGMKNGDRVASINGNAIQTGSDLRNELSKYEPGTVVTVAYVRDGQTYTTQSTLGAKRSYSSHRDPCKIFIGVQLSGADKGIRISGIIDGTAADKSALQTQDIILEMDGVEVNSFDELLVERNKHQPGDDFVLTILRDDQRRVVEAQFLSCDEEKTNEAPVEEEIIEPTTIPDAPVQLVENGLQLEELKAFPNPTYGKFNLQFRGEAVPTHVRVIDIDGKTVYTENLNNFNGLYNRELNIQNAAPGNMVVIIQQGNKVISEQVLLLPRA